MPSAVLVPTSAEAAALIVPSPPPTTTSFFAALGKRLAADGAVAAGDQLDLRVEPRLAKGLADMLANVGVT